MDHHTPRGVGGGRSGVNPHGKESPTINDESIALACDVFDHFCSATTLKSILGLHRHMCDLLKLRPTNLPHFYPKLKVKRYSTEFYAKHKISCLFSVKIAVMESKCVMETIGYSSES